MAKKTLEELAEMRAAGMNIPTEAEIAAKRAARAERAAKRATEKEVLSYYPNNEATKDALTALQRNIRAFRKQALEQGIRKVALPVELKRPFDLALERLNYRKYAPEIQALLIEGLKLQDREVKIESYDYLDQQFQQNGVDFGLVYQMLNKRYVSRYGWMLLRKHATPDSLLVKFGGDIFGDLLDMWSQDPKTQSDWQRLSREDGKPADMREILPRHH